MPKVRVFTSFDFDNDADLRTMLVGQAKNPESPFEIADYSLKEALSGDWKEKIRARIRSVDQVVVICGYQTHRATGVSAELQIAKELDKPYFLLKGRAEGDCTKPKSATENDLVYRWTWDNLKILIGGGR
jgi:hypothetical protein